MPNKVVAKTVKQTVANRANIDREVETSRGIVNLTRPNPFLCPDPIHWPTSCESITAFSLRHLVANSTGVI